MRAESSPAARTGAFIAVAVALFCVQLGFFALNLAVPGIADEFGVTASAAQWTLSAYMLAIGCCFIVGGRVGDVFGRRGALLAGMALFAAGSVGCALASGLWLLVGARIVQGIGAGFVFPVSVSVITNAFPDTTRARALGAAFGIANVGTALGPFVVGGFTEGPGWRWIFWLLAPSSLLALIVAYMYVPDSRDPTAPRQPDLTGCLTVVGSLAALTHVAAWWLYVPVFAWCGLGLGLGWSFAGLVTQQVVAPERAGEASGVLLTFLVTLGGVALAGAAAAITARVPERSPEAAYDTILRFGGAVILAASVVVMAVRHRRVALGGVPPLGSRAPRDGRVP